MDIHSKGGFRHLSVDSVHNPRLDGTADAKNCTQQEYLDSCVDHGMTLTETAALPILHVPEDNPPADQREFVWIVWRGESEELIEQTAVIIRMNFRHKVCVLDLTGLQT